MDYKDKSRKELIILCKQYDIKGYTSKNKNEILALLSEINKVSKEVSEVSEIKEVSKEVEVSEVREVSEVKEVREVSEVKEVSALKPLIKWSGGKGDEIKLFQHHIPLKYNVYLEPFIGGGALYFYLNPKVAVISDVHSELIDLYSVIGQGQGNAIYKFMEQTPNNEETYYNVRDNMIVDNPLTNAQRFYYQRKTCFRGMLRYNKNGKFNIPYGRYKTINYEALNNKDYETLLARTSILCKSFDHIFENYNNEHNFMFLDPPYDSEFTDYGYCQFGKKEQEKLAKCFKETKIKCLMVIGKTAFIQELYKDYIIDEYDKNYRFKLYDGRVGDEINTKHLIIKNY